MNVLLRPVRSSLGSKYVMALTGLGLIGFVVAHMAGNLLVFAGRDALNSYAEALKNHPGLLWTARVGLLAIFLVHVVLGLRLTRQNQAARPVPYAQEDTVQASWASRHMLLTGLLLLAFVVYHLAHFTFGVVARAEVKEDGQTVAKGYLDLEEKGHDPARPKAERHDVYAMVVYGFRNTWISLSYLAAMVFLWLHLWHGASSWFQSLGINHPRYNGFIRGFGPVLATVLLVGNCSMPLAVWLDGACGWGLFKV
jgi:succinate dehydrogenase / fumarate reductase cytochrome b subunit